jgi:hypothetical protein
MPLPPAAAPVSFDMTGDQAWFDQMTLAAADPPGESLIGTIQVQRRTHWKVAAGRLVGPVLVLMVVGVFVVGYFTFDGQGGTPRAAAAKGAAVAATEPAPAAPAPAPAEPAVPAAAPAPAPAPDPAPALAPTPVPAKFVDVMIVSSPAGATVTLVDRGKTSFIGTTPVSTALDPSRKYELLFSHPSKATQTESIDPSATRRVEVKLGGAGTAAAPAKPAVAAPKPAATPAPAAVAEGTLMIASKPPCEIIIDGKPTGLVTPQRSITLPAGSHRVTLVNATENINKTIAIQITAGTPTKVIQDLMAK